MPDTSEAKALNGMRDAVAAMAAPVSPPPAEPAAPPASTEATSSAPETKPETTSPEAQATENKSADGTASGEDKQTLLEAVLKAVEKPKEATPGEAPPATADAAATEPQGDEDDDKPDDGEVPELTEEDFRTRRRFSRRVVRNLYRQMNHYKEQAQSAIGLNDMLQENRITNDEFGAVLSAMVALKRGQMEEFLQIVSPSVELALQATGRMVPPDVQALVQQGHMTSEAARRYAAEQVNRRIAESQRAEYMAAEQGRRDAEYQAQQVTQMRNTVEDWESRIKASDPDYARKADAVLTQVNAMLYSYAQSGEALTPQRALEIANEAYRRTNEQFAAFQPRPQPTSRTPSSVHSSGPGVTRAPSSFLEAVKLGVERSRA